MNKRKFFWLAVVLGALFLGIIYSIGQYYKSKSDEDASILFLGVQCASWIGDQMNSPDARLGGNWEKRGKLVFEVLVPEGNSGTATVYLCVVDRENGVMTKPGAFDAPNWSESQS